jgi:hypothetical protein
MHQLQDMIGCQHIGSVRWIAFDGLDHLGNANPAAVLNPSTVNGDRLQVFISASLYKH